LKWKQTALVHDVEKCRISLGTFAVGSPYQYIGGWWIKNGKTISDPTAHYILMGGSMAKQDCGPEILELQKQMEELRAQQAVQEEKMEPPHEKEASAAGEKDTSSELTQLREKLEEFADLLQQDLKQIPTTTAVAIFALGVLFGRLMPR
jgi:hypothetical protein